MEIISKHLQPQAADICDIYMGQQWKFYVWCILKKEREYPRIRFRLSRILYQKF